ncbi:hypothetical protein G210_1520, partial [Candida maltosa Xu316]
MEAETQVDPPSLNNDSQRYNYDLRSISPIKDDTQLHTSTVIIQDGSQENQIANDSLSTLEDDKEQEYIPNDSLIADSNKSEKLSPFSRQFREMNKKSHEKFLKSYSDDSKGFLSEHNDDSSENVKIRPRMRVRIEDDEDDEDDESTQPDSVESKQSNSDDSLIHWGSNSQSEPQKRTSILQDTQRIPKYEPDTQKIPTRLAETQVISKDDQKSRTQVLNTQEFSDLSISESPTKDDIEIQTDEEDVEPKDTTLEDSLFNNTLKRKISHSPRKLKKSKNTDNFFTSNEIISTPTDGPALRQQSIPLVLASPTEPISLASSPLKNKTITPEDDKSIRTDKIEEDTSGIDTAPLLSSPNKVIKLSFEAEHEPSEVEDFDMSESLGKTSNSKATDEIDEEDDFKVTRKAVVTIDDDDDDDDDLDDIFKTKQSEEPIIPKPRINNVIDSQSGSNPDNDSIVEITTQPEILRHEESDILTEDDIANHDSVWAIYNLKMYTGVVVAKYMDNSNVEFTEGTYNIKNTDLNLLDIRIGDTVYVKTSRFKYIVTGLSAMGAPGTITCMRGYNMVHLQRKAQKYLNSTEIVVPLSEVYMEMSDWANHQQNFKLIIEKRDGFTGKSFSATPIKLSRLSSALEPSSLQSSVFSGMLFCITSIDGDRKTHLKSVIETNGGVLWDQEMHELFQYQQTNDGLCLTTNELEDFEFVALISNNYCRSAKYIQTLALGWPILSDVFIEDMIETNQRVDSCWVNYLLPSGFSKKLHTIKSANVFGFKSNYEKGVSLIQQLNINSSLLQKYNVLVLQNKSINHNSIDTSKFIFHSFGAKSLAYYTKTEDIIDAIHTLDNAIIYDESDEMNQILSKWNTKKRRGKSKQVSIKLIDWEWLVQSVIDGFLQDTITYSIHV